jgi:hypothetical protein
MCFVDSQPESQPAFSCSFSCNFSRLLCRLLNTGFSTSRANSAVVRLRWEAGETLARDTAETPTTPSDVEMVSGETMTETMTLGRKTTKRDATHHRIALQVAPPGIEPGLS